MLTEYLKDIIKNTRILSQYLRKSSDVCVCFSFFYPSRYSHPEQCEGPVDAAGLPASEALRCERVVEQSDPETSYSRRQGRPAVSAHRHIILVIL